MFLLRCLFRIWVVVISAGIFFFPLDNIYAQCPQVEAIMVDACVIGQEHNNEFLIINSGGGFNTNDIQLSYDINNVLANAQNNDINIDIGNYVGDPTPCGLTNGNINAYSGCSNLISIGPGFNVPPNSIVVLQACLLYTSRCV